MPPIFAPIELDDTAAQSLEGSELDNGACFIIHTRSIYAKDEEVPLTDCIDFVEFDEGPTVFIQKGYSIRGILGPLLEPDGIYHLYLFIAGSGVDENGKVKKIPYVAGRINANL